MNPETGRIYHGEEAIAAAKARGEELIELSPGIARALTDAERFAGQFTVTSAEEVLQQRIEALEQMAQKVAR